MASQAGGGGGGVGGSGGAGAAQRGQMQSLAGQGYLYNLTLDGVQSHLGEPLYSMNLEELQKSVFPDGLDPDGGTTSQYEQSLGVLRQGSITMPPVLSEKTMDEVWKDFQFQDALGRNVGEGGGWRREQERQRSLGEMTPEDFLVKAGVVVDGYLNNLSDVGNVEQVGSAGVAGLTAGAHWLDHYQQRITAIKPHEHGRYSLTGANMPGRLALQPLNVGPGAILESYSNGHITSPLMGGLSDSPTPGRKRGSPGDVADKLMERRQKRMIKKRESAARSRARKKAYTNELEVMVCQLEEENEKLKKQNVIREKKKKQKDNDDRVNSLDDLLHDVTAEPINVQLEVLQDITKNFSDERKIGRGGFGIVYKGVLQTGCVAVKKLLNSQTIEDEPFYREVTSLMGVRHKNIVRFLGYCANTDHKFIKMEGLGSRQKPIYCEIRERLLCFDYMSNGGLDNHLTDELRGLEWHTRYQIIKGICEGLQYLHKENIVHMDLKPANILLDDHMEPKITDFGISRNLDGVSRYVTKQRLISLGYSAPEYANRGEVSFKADIFSLGAIITEIVTGRKQDTDSKNVLRRWRYRWNRSGKYPPLGYQQISKCIEISRSCLAENPKLRPYIWDIIIDQNEQEKTNEHMTNAVESMVGQISPYPWELLVIDPLELNFPFKPNKQIQSSFELNNERDDYVAFKIQKPSILNYLVEPNKGIVPPHSRSSVIVTLQASNRAPDDKLCKENFVVQCAIVDDGLAAANVNEDVFDNKLGKVVDEVILTVAFT